MAKKEASLTTFHRIVSSRKLTSEISSLDMIQDTVRNLMVGARKRIHIQIGHSHDEKDQPTLEAVIGLSDYEGLERDLGLLSRDYVIEETANFPRRGRAVKMKSFYTCARDCFNSYGNLIAFFEKFKSDCAWTAHIEIDVDPQKWLSRYLYTKVNSFIKMSEWFSDYDGGHFKAVSNGTSPRSDGSGFVGAKFYIETSYECASIFYDDLSCLTNAPGIYFKQFGKEKFNIVCVDDVAKSLPLEFRHSEGHVPIRRGNLEGVLDNSIRMSKGAKLSVLACSDEKQLCDLVGRHLLASHQMITPNLSMICTEGEHEEFIQSNPGLIKAIDIGYNYNSWVNVFDAGFLSNSISQDHVDSIALILSNIDTKLPGRKIFGNEPLGCILKYIIQKLFEYRAMISPRAYESGVCLDIDEIIPGADRFNGLLWFDLSIFLQEKGFTQLAKKAHYQAMPCMSDVSESGFLRMLNLGDFGRFNEYDVLDSITRLKLLIETFPFIGVRTSSDDFERTNYAYRMPKIKHSRLTPKEYFALQLILMHRVAFHPSSQGDGSHHRVIQFSDSVSERFDWNVGTLGTNYRLLHRQGCSLVIKASDISGIGIENQSMVDFILMGHDATAQKPFSHLLSYRFNTYELGVYEWEVSTEAARLHKFEGSHIYHLVTRGDSSINQLFRI